MGEKGLYIRLLHIDTAWQGGREGRREGGREERARWHEKGGPDERREEGRGRWRGGWVQGQENCWRNLIPNTQRGGLLMTDTLTSSMTANGEGYGVWKDEDVDWERRRR
jgi:hypothetical protein